MKDFLLNLYSNDNFVLYLTVSLCVLIMLFVIVFVFGKNEPKKKKEVKTSNKPVTDTFKEEEKTDKIEIKKDKLDDKEEKMIEHEQIPILPNTEEKEDIVSVYEPMELTNPLVNNTPEEKTEDVDFQKKLSEFRKLQEEYNKLKLEDDNNRSRVVEQTPYQAKATPVQVKEEVPEKNISIDIKIDDEEDFDMPVLKNKTEEEVKTAAPLEQNNDKPKTFDELFGETYNINK